VRSEMTEGQGRSNIQKGKTQKVRTVENDRGGLLVKGESRLSTLAGHCHKNNNFFTTKGGSIRRGGARGYVDREGKVGRRGRFSLIRSVL